MTTEIGDALRRAADGLATPLTALFAVGFAVLGAVQTVAYTLVWYETFRDDVWLGMMLPGAPLQHLGLVRALPVEVPTAAAAAAWLLAWVGSLVLLVVAIDAYARGVDDVGELGPDRLAWKTANLAGGWIAWGLAVALTVWLFGLGLFLGAVLLFYPVAIVRDDEWFGAAFVSSVRRFGDAPGVGIVVTAVVLVLYGAAWVLGFVVGIGTGVLGDPTVAVAVDTAASEAVGAAVWTVTWALLTAGYVVEVDDGEDATEHRADARHRRPA